MKEFERALQTAMAAADAADAVAMRYFGAGIDVETKADDSPVTRADREAEQAIRERLTAAFPEYAVFGEEYGMSGDADRLWLIDPIDGTRSFIRGLPFWSVQIALMIGGELVLGVSSAPAFGERAWAVRGQGALITCGNAHSERQPPGGGAFESRQVESPQTSAPDGASHGETRRLTVHPCEDLGHADISLGNLSTLAGGAQWQQLAVLVEQAARIRGYGDFYPYHRLAAGQLDAVVESDVNILDIAALAVIVREAGGVFTDLDGGPVDLNTTSVLAAGPTLHGQLLRMMRDER